MSAGISKKAIACFCVLAALLILVVAVAVRDDTVSERSIFRNHLAGQQSPYLLQHADNPVDWYPWSEEAFEKARKEDKPIFLSIGYSTCHWCHVMEHESFEDEEVARLMNDVFVSIKVDREERPDIDNIYMTVCRMITGGGGWPLTIIMTPGKQPFFAATYIPRESRHGRSGMLELIPRIKELWLHKREEIDQSALEVASALRTAEDVSGKEPDVSILSTAFEQLRNTFDSLHGGFGAAPKFPSPHNLLFLLRYWNRSGEREALAMVEKTLGEMRKGGIYDHVGFGFHRYSTDNQWLLPHFEKMLYDQALLAIAYTELFQATGKDEYEQTAREIVTYVLRDMTDPKGGFYSAEDADSEGEEGKFYLWSEIELRLILGISSARLIESMYNFETDGNFLDQATGKKTGRNILFLGKSRSDRAGDLNLSEDELQITVRRALRMLFDAREKRIHPQKDDKILTDWNGLMIAALAIAGRSFNEPEYVLAAEKSAQFILDEMRTSDGRLYHRHRGGQSGINGNLDDYAFMVFGLIELYQATFNIEYLGTALDLNKDMMDHFQDRDSGGFFFTADDAEQLLVRQKEFYDGAIPSGNSVAAYNLIRLARLTGRSELEELAFGVFRSVSRIMNSSPTAFTFLLTALDFARGPSAEVVMSGEKESAGCRSMIEALWRSYSPAMVVLQVDRGNRTEMMKIAPFAGELREKDGQPLAYVCRNFICDLPVDSPEALIEKLHSAEQETGFSE